MSDAYDQRLIDAYTRVGVPLWSLPHTPHMTRLALAVNPRSLHRLPIPMADAEKAAVFQRLLALDRAGKLPRIEQEAKP